MEVIVKNVARTSPVNRLAIATGLEQTEFQHSTTPLKSLRHLELTSFFPIDGIVDTLSTLSGSPIETVAIQCFNDDVEDLCQSVETFLNERVERGSDQFHKELKQVFITLVPLEGDEEAAGFSSAQLYEMLEGEQRDAIKKLEELSNDLGLRCGVLGVGVNDGCCTSAIGFGGLRHTGARNPTASEATPISGTLTSPCL